MQSTGQSLRRAPSACSCCTSCGECWRGTANPDVPRFAQNGPEWEFYGPPYASAWSFLSLCVPGSRRRAARCLRRRRCLGSCGMFVFPSARRGVRASFDRYGHNRTVGVHVSWPDARPRAGTGTLGDTLSADGPREPCLGIVARTQKWDESQGNPKVVRTPPIVKGLESRGGKFERSSETQES